jgi:APA family basic amino acid/polyamine antiporter
MYLAVVLQEIATAESDRVAVVASQYIFGSVGITDRDHYDIDLLVIMVYYGWCTGVLYNGARRSLSRKQLNEAKVPAWSGCSVWAGFVSYWKVW